MLRMQRSRKPTHATITRFIESLLPLKENDVPRLYHVPRNPRYDAETAVADQLVLSVTPTAGVRKLIGYVPEDSIPASLDSRGPFRPRPPRTLCFLHRPFDLDRRSVRRGTIVLSSHTSFDELLTTGWNTALAARLSMDVERCLCVQGYKGDPERRIGIVGEVAVLRDVLLKRIEEEFGQFELGHDGLSDQIRVIAIMNAFHGDEVNRVLQMAIERGIVHVDGDAPGKHILYLTGQARAGGLEAARALGMTVVCVGHRQAEVWGIRYLGEQLRQSFPGVRVEEIYEDEEPKVKVKKPKAAEEIPKVFAIEES